MKDIFQKAQQVYGSFNFTGAYICINHTGRVYQRYATTSFGSVIISDAIYLYALFFSFSGSQNNSRSFYWSYVNGTWSMHETTNNIWDAGTSFQFYLSDRTR